MSAFLISVFEFLTFLQTHQCVLLSHNSWDFEGVFSERTCWIGSERKELSNQVVCTGLWLGAHEEVRGVIIGTTELTPTWEQCWLFPLGLCPSLRVLRRPSVPWTDYFKEVLGGWYSQNWDGLWAWGRIKAELYVGHFGCTRLLRS